MAFTADRLGQVNGAGDASALFLKVFTGEVITAFKKYAVTLDKHFIRSIDSGKSVSFPLIGRRTTANYVSPGSDITFTANNKNEQVITVDMPLYDSAAIPQIDELMNHYDVRSRWVERMAENIAMQFDQNVLCEVILGARSAALVTGLEAGYVHSDVNLTSATPATKFTAWKAALVALAEKFDNNYVSPNDRYLGITPSLYYFLMTNAESNGFSFINRDFGGDGSISTGVVGEFLGFKVVKTPNLPQADLTAKAYHGVNAAKTQAVAWTPDAVGTVKLMDITTESEWDINKQSTILVTKCAMGHKFLIPGGLAEFVIP